MNKTLSKIVKWVSVLLGVIFMTSCSLNTSIVREPRICRQYYLLPNASLLDNRDAYSDLALDNMFTIDEIFKSGTANVNNSRINFYYDGNVDFRLEYTNGDIVERLGTYRINDTSNTTFLIFQEETLQCPNTFSRKADGDTLITYLRVPYSAIIDEEERNFFLWFFNGIFVACPFDSGE